MITPTKEFWEVFKKTSGALSCAESLAIMNIAALAPIDKSYNAGIYCELGTHMGKSAISALQSLKDGYFTAVDIMYFDKEVRKLVFDFINDNVPDKKRLKCFTSEINSIEFIPTIDGQLVPHIQKYSYVFVDTGSHGDGLPMAEVKLLEDRMMDGGIIAFHDYKNQFVEVEGAYNYLVSTGKYEPIEINWQEIFDYVKEHNLEEGNNSWHLYPELPHPPNFVGALKRK